MTSDFVSLLSYPLYNYSPGTYSGWWQCSKSCSDENYVFTLEKNTFFSEQSRIFIEAFFEAEFTFIIVIYYFTQIAENLTWERYFRNKVSAKPFFINSLIVSYIPEVHSIAPYSSFQIIWKMVEECSLDLGGITPSLVEDWWNAIRCFQSIVCHSVSFSCSDSFPFPVPVPHSPCLQAFSGTAPIWNDWT